MMMHILLAQAQAAAPAVDHTAELIRQLPAILTAAGIVISALFAGIGGIITLIFTRLNRIKEEGVKSSGQMQEVVNGTAEVHRMINSEWDKFKADHKVQAEKDMAEAVRRARAEAEKTAREVALVELQKLTKMSADYEKRLADGEQKLAIETLRTNMTPAVAFVPQAVSPEPLAAREPVEVKVVNPPESPVPIVQAGAEDE